MCKLSEQFMAARSVGTPLVMVVTPDPKATIDSLAKAIESRDAERKVTSPMLQWDVSRGVLAIKESSVKLAGTFQDCKNPVDLIEKVIQGSGSEQLLPARSVLFCYNLCRQLDPLLIQAIWNLRDEFKRNSRTLVMLGQSCILPPELANDVLVIDEPLPQSPQLEQIVRKTHEYAKLECSDEVVAKAVEAVRGLAAYPAEQAVAMSLRPSGLDVDSLWERKRQMIEATPGLSVFRDGETFADIGGCDAIKSFLGDYLKGKARPNAVVFLDEIEKQLAGAGGDLSGTTDDQLGAILSYMQDHKAAGMLFVGPPGAAKSAMAKAIGNEAGIPTVQLDLGAAKGSLVGQSEQQVRAALKTITAVSNEKSLWIATCNSHASLRPELKRRFNLSSWIFDFPTQDERKVIWKIWQAKCGVEKQELPDDSGWTGAEIRQCCHLADVLGRSLKDVAKHFIVPVSVSAKDDMDKLRRAASGKFLSASKPGIYEFEESEKAVRRAARQIDVSNN